jgi:5'-phosphate synthase pdxT subunit
MTTPVIGVLAIQGDVREHRASLESAGAATVLVKSTDALDEVDGLVIPGGESTTMSILAIKNGLLEPLIAKREAGLPMYGSCAGLIMLADRIADGRSDQRTIGGLNITATRNAFGRQVDSFETDLAIPAIGAPDFHAIFIRAPLVTEIGAEVEVIATLPTDSTRIVAVRQNNLLATSFHPEITSDNRIHKLFVDMVRKS